MSYKLVVSPYFEQELKRLAKKYSSVRDDYRALLNSLLENPTQGSALEKIAVKFEWLFVLKTGVKVAEPA